MKFQQKDHNGFLHEPAEPSGITATDHRVRRQIQRWAYAATFGLIWAPAAVLGGTLCQPNVMMEHAVSGHDDVLLAGFGFQSSAASSITIRTYQAHTGAILSENFYDLSVQEEGTSAATTRGRIFAGGIGMDAEGRSRFLLRVYDALNGRFLWEGELNLISQKEERRARPIATVTPSRSVVSRTSIKRQSPVEAQFSLRAVDPQSGRLLWEDRFIPGAATAGRADKTGFLSIGRSAQIETIGHFFDLLVRTFDRTSGRLLWQDSFEEAYHVDRPEKGEHLPEPQMMPFLSGEKSRVQSSIGNFQPGYDRGWCSLEWNSSVHCCWNLS